MLVVFDDNAQTIAVLPVNRDLMAEIAVVNLLGETIGTKTSQICMAYSYGDGEKGMVSSLVVSR